MKIKLIIPQKKKTNETANYGIKPYSKDMHKLHKDIMDLLTSKKYQEISADDCMIVFGRCYSVYCQSQLIKEGKIKTTNKG